jgi:hypothetical protein
LAALAAAHPDVAREAAASRPVLARIGAGIEALESALDAERRALIRANERRLRRYLAAAQSWAGRWPDVDAEVVGLPLARAHAVVAARAEGTLPFEPPEEPSDHVAR